MVCKFTQSGPDWQGVQSGPFDVQPRRFSATFSGRLNFWEMDFRQVEDFNTIPLDLVVYIWTPLSVFVLCMSLSLCQSLPACLSLYPSISFAVVLGALDKVFLLRWGGGGGGSRGAWGAFWTFCLFWFWVDRGKEACGCGPSHCLHVLYTIYSSVTFFYWHWAVHNIEPYTCCMTVFCCWVDSRRDPAAPGGAEVSQAPTGSSGKTGAWTASKFIIFCLILSHG